MPYITAFEIQKNPDIYKNSIKNMSSWILREDFVFQIFDKMHREAKILDIGCANGYFLDRLADLNFVNLYGADLSNFLQGRKYNFQAIDINREKLPHEDGFFDVVTAFQIIEHLENYFLIIKEAERVLKRGGMFIFSVPNQFNIFYRFKFFLTGNMPGWSAVDNHLLFATRDVFKKTYLKNFVIDEVYYRKGPLPMFGRLTNILNKIPGVKLSHKLRIMPRCEIFADDVCYVLRKK